MIWYYSTACLLTLVHLDHDSSVVDVNVNTVKHTE